MNNDEKLNYSVEARFGEVITGEKWGVIPFALYLHQKELELDIHDVWFLTWLIMHKWTEKKPFPSIAKMARITDISETYIRGISKDLQKRGYINVEKRFRADGGQNTNMYDLNPLFIQLEDLIKNVVPLEDIPAAAEKEEDGFMEFPEDDFEEELTEEQQKELDEQIQFLDEYNKEVAAMVANMDGR